MKDRKTADSVRSIGNCRPIAVIAALLLGSLLSFRAAWAMPPTIGGFRSDLVGRRTTPASGPYISLASTPDLTAQSDPGDSATRTKSRWPAEAHGWSKAAIYGIEFAGAAVPLYGSLGPMSLLLPRGSSGLDPDVGMAASGMAVLGEALSIGMTLETGRLLRQEGDVPNTCIGSCVGLSLAAVGGVLVAYELKGAPAVALAIPLTILQPALTVIGYNALPRPLARREPPPQRETGENQK